jgi:hypothetical protein
MFLAEYLHRHSRVNEDIRSRQRKRMSDTEKVA